MPGARATGMDTVFNDYGISIWSDEKFLELDSGNGCAIMWIYFMLLTNMLNFIVLYHNFKQ